MSSTIRKAVFPAAGLGTRFLPATKVQPKEMLTLVDKPIIQYGVEEAVASGLTDIIIISSRGKSVIEDHFDVSAELETHLLAKGKHGLLEEVRKVSSLITVSSVRQGQPLGHVAAHGGGEAAARARRQLVDAECTDMHRHLRRLEVEERSVEAG